MLDPDPVVRFFAIVDRFMVKVERRTEKDCWPWLAGKFKSGYVRRNRVTASIERTASQ